MASDEKKDKDEASADPKSLLGEAFKKVFSAGVSAAFMTEESIRAYLQDLKLPKEILNIILQNANKSKDEITSRVSGEIIKIVSKIDWVKEFARFAENHKFKVSAEIEIIRRQDSSEPPASSN